MTQKTRLESQMQFLNEAEKLKTIYRHNKTVDRVRHENSAEHSWHVALMALTLAEYAENRSLNILKVLTMLLIHDLIEIHAGDTWIYDDQAVLEQTSTEMTSATKLFSLLPPDQEREFQSLWQEFEEQQTPEAIFAASIDALQPLSNHLLSADTSRTGPRPERAKVFERKRHIEKGSRHLWQLAQVLIDQSTEKGLYL